MARAGRIYLTYSICGGSEKAQNVLHLVGTDDFEPSVVAPLLSGYLSTFWTAIRANHNGSVRMASARVERIDPQTGKALYGQDASVPGTTGSLATVAAPPQCATVVSLRTATQGRRSRGRMYLPPPALSVLNQNGDLQSSAAVVYADAIKALFESLNALISVDAVSVYSRTSGGFFPITSVDVGTIIDTQRGRRNKLVESRTTRSVAN